MKKIIYSIIGVASILGAFYYYTTRPLSAPSVEQTELASEDVSSRFPTYTISESSTVTFTLGEILRGKPFTVVGTTNNLSGTLALSENPALERVLVVGEIKVNARTFKTDSTQRDGAIGRLILKSENPEYEFITFTPNADAEIFVAPDGTFNDTIAGTVTIAGITKPTLFTVTGNTSTERVSGTAETTINRTDFGLTIPNLSFIANVDETVAVKITLSAEAQK